MEPINVTSVPKTATFQIWINSEVKKRVEDIYARQGLTFTDTVNIFLNSIVSAQWGRRTRCPLWRKPT